MVYMLSLVLPFYGLYYLWPFREKLVFMEDDLARSVSCPFTLFNRFNGLVMFVPSVEVALLAYHVFSSCCKGFSMVDHC
jgi:hypothetical protein